MKCDEIFAALAMLEKERGIPQSFMMEKIVQALTTAYKRDHEGVENVVVDVNEERKDLRMYVQKEVVEEVENPGSQMSIEEAKAKYGRAEVGDFVKIPVDNVEFGRIVLLPAPIPATATYPCASATARRAPRRCSSPASRCPARRWWRICM